MSENVEVVRRTLEAFNREGVDAALAYFDPEIEWLGPPGWLEKHLYKGHDGIREIAALWRENFEEFHLDLEDAIEAGIMSWRWYISAGASKMAVRRSNSELATTGRSETARASVCRFTSLGRRRCRLLGSNRRRCRFARRGTAHR
jgi:ketosteroid isomerase-like protein